jgi:hypothetical protein
VTAGERDDRASRPVRGAVKDRTLMTVPMVRLAASDLGVRLAGEELTEVTAAVLGGQGLIHDRVRAELAARGLLD